MELAQTAMINIMLLVIIMFAALAFLTFAAGLKAILVFIAIVGFALFFLLIWGVWIQNNVRL